jgi:hypothetical protein
MPTSINAIENHTISTVSNRRKALGESAVWATAFRPSLMLGESPSFTAGANFTVSRSCRLASQWAEWHARNVFLMQFD